MATASTARARPRAVRRTRAVRIDRLPSHEAASTVVKADPARRGYVLFFTFGGQPRGLEGGLSFRRRFRTRSAAPSPVPPSGTNAAMTSSPSASGKASNRWYVVRSRTGKGRLLGDSLPAPNPAGDHWLGFEAATCPKQLGGTRAQVGMGVEIVSTDGPIVNLSAISSKAFEGSLNPFQSVLELPVALVEGPNPLLPFRALPGQPEELVGLKDRATEEVGFAALASRTAAVTEHAKRRDRRQEFDVAE